jgi:hypothetical protein
MPEVSPLLNSILPHLQYNPDDYLVDVKVHMLMPGEYPCLPNWHRDFVPRDEDKKLLLDEITQEDLMYIHVSGEPFTEWKGFRDQFKSDGFNWIAFNQKDIHRGVKSEVHTWRGFMRLIPKWFVHPGTKNMGQIRRHTQVYIDNPENFKW